MRFVLLLAALAAVTANAYDLTGKNATDIMKLIDDINAQLKQDIQEDIALANEKKQELKTDVTNKVNEKMEDIRNNIRERIDQIEQQRQQEREAFDQAKQKLVEEAKQKLQQAKEAAAQREAEKSAQREQKRQELQAAFDAKKAEWQQKKADEQQKKTDALNHLKELINEANIAKKEQKEAYDVKVEEAANKRQEARNRLSATKKQLDAEEEALNEQLAAFQQHQSEFKQDVKDALTEDLKEQFTLHAEKQMDAEYEEELREVAKEELQKIADVGLSEDEKAYIENKLVEKAQAKWDQIKQKIQEKKSASSPSVSARALLSDATIDSAVDALANKITANPFIPQDKKNQIRDKFNTVKQDIKTQQQEKEAQMLVALDQLQQWKEQIKQKKSAGTTETATAAARTFDIGQLVGGKQMGWQQLEIFNKLSEKRRGQKKEEEDGSWGVGKILDFIKQKRAEREAEKDEEKKFKLDVFKLIKDKIYGKKDKQTETSASSEEDPNATVEEIKARLQKKREQKLKEWRETFEKLAGKKVSWEEEIEKLKPIGGDSASNTDTESEVGSVEAVTRATLLETIYGASNWQTVAWVLLALCIVLALTLAGLIVYQVVNARRDYQNLDGVNTAASPVRGPKLSTNAGPLQPYDSNKAVVPIEDAVDGAGGSGEKQQF